MAALCLLPILARAQDPAISIIPKPVSMTIKQGEFRLTPETVLVAGDELEALGRQLAGMLAPATGFDLKVNRSKRERSNSIVLRLDPGLRHLGDEGYRLEVTPQRVRIRAPAPAGIFYAFQTLRQLLPPAIFREARVDGVDWTIPCVVIDDHPRFRWRGMHLDVCRHFMPKDFVKKYIDLLALHKMNSFHWHLTEDQGWRIEIKKYPKLTEVGAWRDQTLVGNLHDEPRKFDGKRHGGFYTQDDVREIVAYARDRRVTIVPEIEMPGHAQAAIAAYPELGNTGLQLPVRTFWGVNENIFNADEETILFLQDVLAEVLELFPGEFIHIGGDEAVKTQWEETPEARARIRELGLRDAEELQSYFIQRMDAFLTEKGRRLIGWDEILEGGLAPGATVMSWRGEDGGIAAAKAGHDAVMAPYSHLYFDYAQGDQATEP
ncbi:MAG: beta-N-acetylhexosaminidase, partial [bacterium]|nr:beta-N-acetylhexosaminidase [bacterium]